MFQLTSCNSEAISTELTTDRRVGLKMTQNSVPNQKQVSSLHVITPLNKLLCSMDIKKVAYVAEIVETLDLNKEGPMVSQQFFHVWKDFKTNILKAVCR